MLDLLPPYLNTASLVKLCLVSKAYYATFIPYLWGSPASHFVQVHNESAGSVKGIKSNLQVTGSHNDMVYVALTRFKRTLRRARLSTRMLCHTLHLPPALSEIYGGPNATWLREVLDWLPALQSLCVSGLPFFDHDSLVAVDRTRNSSIPTDPDQDDFRRYPVKLLLAAKEPNLTAVGLSLLLPHLPDLVYLDLSYTTPARDINVLSALNTLPHLQVLKLRGIGLRDNEAEALANAIGLRVRLLDIAENNLSDMAVRSLLQACVWLPSTQATNENMPNDQYSRRHLESWPVGLPPPPDSLSLDTIRTVDLDDALLTQLTHPLTGRLAFEDIPHGGITHLYISGNSGVTIESIRSILDLGRLHVLDAGDIAALTAVDIHVLEARKRSKSIREVNRTKSINGNTRNIKGLLNRRKSPPSSLYSTESMPAQDGHDEEDEIDMLKLPGAEKLVPVLYEKASKNLTHIRIDHAVVTAVLDITKELKEKDKVISNKQELPGSLTLAAELSGDGREVFEVFASRNYATEMPSDNAIFEMDASPAAPRVELPGDPIHFAISPPIGDAPQMSTVEEVMSPIRGEGAMAPEVVKEKDPEPDDDEEVVLDATGSGIRRRPNSVSESTVISDVSTLSSTQAPDMPAPLQLRKKPVEHKRNISQTSTANLQQISEITSLRPKPPITRLHPSHLPNLRTLVLTNLPPKVPPSQTSIIHNLKSFIAACAAEARLAILKARTNYSLPPGRARQDAERQHARTLFALRSIVLEINPEESAAQQRDWKHTRQRLNISKSSTGDMDSESLWSAAENDFSFFGEEGEESAECGIYDQEPDKYYPTIPFDDKIVVTNDNHFPPGSPQSPSVPSLRIGSPTSSSAYGSTLGPMSPLMRNGTVMQSPRNLPLGRNRRTSNDMQRINGGNGPDIRMSPRGAPGNFYNEMLGTIPPPQTPRSAPTSHPVTTIVPVLTSQVQQEVMLDVVAELAAWRKERKAAYEEECRRQQRLGRRSSNSATRLAECEAYVEGYWSGEVKVVRNAKPSKGNTNKGRMERTGNVDVFGNYFEGGYLYP